MADLKKRRHAREWAVQLLFQLDMNPKADLERTLTAFWHQLAACRRDEMADAETSDTRFDADAELPSEEAQINALAPAKLRLFAENLVRGAVTNREMIDTKLAAYTQNWPLHRMGVVDRNVLRLAIYEMFFGGGVPAVVCINEAVDLAKFFSSTESGRFVNGILDRAARDAPRSARR